MKKVEIDAHLSFWRARQQSEPSKDVFRFKMCCTGRASAELEPAKYKGKSKRQPQEATKKQRRKKKNTSRISDNIASADPANENNWQTTALQFTMTEPGPNGHAPGIPTIGQQSFLDINMPPSARETTTNVSQCGLSLPTDMQQQSYTEAPNPLLQDLDPELLAYLQEDARSRGEQNNAGNYVELWGMGGGDFNPNHDPQGQGNAIPNAGSATYCAGATTTMSAVPTVAPTLDITGQLPQSAQNIVDSIGLAAASYTTDHPRSTNEVLADPVCHAVGSIDIIATSGTDIPALPHNVNTRSKRKAVEPLECDSAPKKRGRPRRLAAADSLAGEDGQIPADSTPAVSSGASGRRVSARVATKVAEEEAAQAKEVAALNKKQKVTRSGRQ
jgi:hypothetical protein